jgi:hypothetical protein
MVRRQQLKEVVTHSPKILIRSPPGKSRSWLQVLGTKSAQVLGVFVVSCDARFELFNGAMMLRR